MISIIIIMRAQYYRNFNLLLTEVWGKKWHAWILLMSGAPLWCRCGARSGCHVIDNTSRTCLHWRRECLDHSPCHDEDLRPNWSATAFSCPLCLGIDELSSKSEENGNWLQQLSALYFLFKIFNFEYWTRVDLFYTDIYVHHTLAYYFMSIDPYILKSVMNNPIFLYLILCY